MRKRGGGGWKRVGFNWPNISLRYDLSTVQRRAGGVWRNLWCTVYTLLARSRSKKRRMIVCLIFYVRYWLGWDYYMKDFDCCIFLGHIGRYIFGFIENGSETFALGRTVQEEGDEEVVSILLLDLLGVLSSSYDLLIVAATRTRTRVGSC